MTLSNVKWADDRYADGSFTAYAWATNGLPGETIARADAPTCRDAYKALHRQLCLFHKIGFAETLVSADGSKITRDGMLHWQTGEVLD